MCEVTANYLLCEFLNKSVFLLVPSLQRPHSSYSQTSISDDIQVTPLLEPLSPSVESPPASPSEPKKAQGHFQKAKERFKKHFRKRTGEITLQQRLEAEMTLTDGGSVSKGKRRSSGESPAPKKSNMNIHSRSQWRYPTNQLISDATELGNMNNFLLTKVRNPNVNNCTNIFKFLTLTWRNTDNNQHCGDKLVFQLPKP